MAWIYSISYNGKKVYIGATRNSWKNRIKEHFKPRKINNLSYIDYYLQMVDKTKITVEPIQECYENELFQLESDYIKLYKPLLNYLKNKD